MVPVFEKASDSVNSSPTGKAKVTIKPRLRCQSENLTDFFLLGSHPQGFYKTYIPNSVAEALIHLKYKLKDHDRTFPSSLSLGQIVREGLVKTSTDDNQAPVSLTKISKPFIKLAGNWPRIRSQNAVMGGVSANKVSGICLSTIETWLI